MNFILDTNVLIYVLNKTQQSAVDFLASLRASERAISPVTWMEVLTGVREENEAATRELLSNFQLVSLESGIMERTVLIRRSMRLKLPDAIIYASALATGRTLVTYNIRDFPLGTPSVFCPGT